MPKSQYLDPKALRAPGKVTFTDIPVNVYQKSVKDEKKNFPAADLVRIYRDMAIIREFETMINLIKTTGEYQGVPYNHPGPAHLSMGQEASAVGQAYHLDCDDFIFGSHRSHGEILAKGLSAIEKLAEDELLGVMKGFMGGAALKVVEGEPHESVKALAVDFLLYGALAEIFARQTGFNMGLGGSMHAFFTPFGIYPNNALVGGSADVAMGAGLFKRVNRSRGIVVSNIGDAAMGCGPVWEALNFAAMDQLRLLWDEAHRGGLPVLFNFFNNQYGMGGQTAGETMAYGILARVGAGVSPTQLHAERVDGFNPLAVIEAMGRKKALLLAGDGPVLLDTLTYRYAGHSPSDSSSYRTKEEIAAWQEADPLLTYRSQLIEAKLATSAACEQILADAQRLVLRAMKLAIDPALSPVLNLAANPQGISALMYSNGSATAMAEGAPEALMPLADNPRVQSLKGKARYAYDEAGKPVSKNKLYQFRDGIFEALIDRFYKDPTLVAYGEENRDWGGAFAVYRGLTEALPYHRLFNAPISEGAIVGSAVGYAMCGGRAVVELMYCDFLGRAGDEVFNQLAKWQSMSAGILKMPVVLRVSVGSKYGAQHSQDWSALVAHIPGLKVVFPATPYDAKGLMNAALQGTDPVVFLESQRLYDVGEQFNKNGVPEGYYEIAMGEPDVKLAGNDVTILTIGAALYRAMDAAKELKDRYGLSAEIIDARSLVPFNYEPVLASVKKTGRILLVGDACSRGSLMSEMAATIGELAFDDLDAPPVVVGARNWITPAYELESAYFPQPSWILDAIHQLILPLPGHVPGTDWTAAGRIRNAKAGV